MSGDVIPTTHTADLLRIGESERKVVGHREDAGPAEDRDTRLMSDRARTYIDDRICDTLWKRERLTKHLKRRLAREALQAIMPQVTVPKTQWRAFLDRILTLMTRWLS